MTLREVLGNCGIYRQYNIEYKKYVDGEPVLTGHSKWDGEKLIITDEQHHTLDDDEITAYGLNKDGLLIVFHKGLT